MISPKPDNTKPYRWQASVYTVVPVDVDTAARLRESGERVWLAADHPEREEPQREQADSCSG